MQKTHSQKNLQKKTIRREKLLAPRNLSELIKSDHFSFFQIDSDECKFSLPPPCGCWLNLLILGG
jgi:hypothetical protein